MPARSLAEFVRTYDDVLPAPLCAGLIESFERFTSLQERNGAGVRPGLEASAWYEMDVGAHADQALRYQFIKLIEQYHQRYNADLAMPLPVSAPRRTDRLILKRYRPGGERFQLHFDSVGPVSNRYLVYLWYLNTVDQGGETHFPELDVAIKPKAGRLVMFPPYWMFQHAGLPPVSGDKFILSTYLVY